MLTNPIHERIKTLAFSSSDELLFKSFLKILEDSLAEKLDHSRQQNLQTVLIDVDTQQGQQAWESRENSTPNKVYVAYTSEYDNFPADYCLSKPVRGRELLQLFEDISSASHRKNSIELAEKQEHSIEFSPKPQQSNILNLLLSPMVERPTLFRSRKTPEFVIDKPRQLCFMQAKWKALLPLGSLDIKTIDAIPLTFDELRSLEKKYTAIPLQTFLWYAGLNFSAGNLLPEPKKLGKVSLQRWPDFDHLPHSPHHQRLATYMMTRPGSVESIAKHAKTNIAVTINFINACYLCGWLKNTSIRAHGIKAPAPQKPGNVVEKLYALFKAT